MVVCIFVVLFGICLKIYLQFYNIYSIYVCIYSIYSIYVSTVSIYSIYTQLADVSTSGGHHNQGRDQNYFSGNLQLFWDQ